MTVATALAFLGIATIAYVTPGPDWFVVLRHAATGRRNGYAAALGVQSGLVVHMTAAALGVATLLLASAQAFTVLKLLGAGYLILLGIQALLRAHRADGTRGGPQGSDRPTPVALVLIYRQAFVANVLNPKAALFFVAVLPQFLSTSAPVATQVLLLGVLDIALGLVWWAVFVRGVGGVTRLLGHTRSAVVVDRVSGASLIGLGGALALTGPPRP